MHRRRDHSLKIAITAAAAAWIGAVVPGSAIAQTQYAVEASQVHQPGAGENNAAEALLNVLSEMDVPPASIVDTPTALLMLPGDPGWDEAKDWATAPNQRAMLTTLRDVTNPSNPHIFALPYGLANTPPAIAKSGMAVELGDPPLLVNGDFSYLDALDELFALVSIDAARLAEDSDPEAAYKLIQWIRLARMVADQPLSIEKGWGIRSMRLGVMRLLDLFALNPKLMTEREIVRLVREIKESEIRVERIGPPYADRLAMEELVAATYIERRGPNPSTFGPVLATVSTEGRSLDLFGEVAFYQQVAEQQANWFDTTEAIEAIYNDWERRWAVPHYDRIWTQQMERRLIDPARFVLIEGFSPDLYPMFEDRLALRADMAGARMALSSIGYRQGKGVWPSDLAALRPTFVDNIDIDPYHDGGDRFIKQFDIINYFVPIRDQKFAERVDPHPHPMRVFRAGNIFGNLDSAPIEFDFAMLDDAIALIIAAFEDSRRNTASEAFEAVVEPLIEAGFTRSNYKAKIRNGDAKRILAGMSPKAPGSQNQNLAEMAGLPSELTDEDYVDLAIEELRLLFESADFVRAFGLVRRGDRVRKEDAIPAIRAMLDAGVQSMNNLIRRLAPSSFGPDHFDVELSDNVFVIFARGTDRRADWAREVGPQAADYLVWPPVLTLLRSELREEPPMAAWDD